MPGFTKLFSEIITSSVWNEADKTRIVWITMMASADPYGMVRASVSGLAHIARVDRASCERALEVLSSPDSDSRSPEFEGRRIQKVPGGWLILNYTKYREARHADERKSYMASYMRDYRAKRRVNNNVNESKQALTSVNHSKPRLAKAEAEAEADIFKLTSEEKRVQREKPISSPTAARKKSIPKEDPDFARFWFELPTQNKIGKKKAREAWARAIGDGAAAEQIISGISSYKKYERRRREQPDYRPLHPTTWLNQGRWEDGDNGEHEEKYNPCS